MGGGTVAPFGGGELNIQFPSTYIHAVTPSITVPPVHTYKEYTPYLDGRRAWYHTHHPPSNAEPLTSVICRWLRFFVGGLGKSGCGASESKSSVLYLHNT